MSHLAEEYAKSCGVKIGKPILKPHYFPILHDKYITIHNDKKVQSKEYDMWPDVIELLKKVLGDIKIIQIGAHGEESIQGVDQHIPTTSLKQAAFIIKKSLGHVGIDSVPVHIASALDKPVVGIYAHTYASTCEPLWNETTKAITIESDRGGNKPSFSLEEYPKTINFIKPEQIASAVVEVLNLDKKINHKTLHIGQNYTSNFVEVIPTEFTNIKANHIDVRMDYSHNENVLWHILQNNHAEVTLSKPIPDKFFQSGKIKKVIYKSDILDTEFCNKIKSLGIPHNLICTSAKTLSQERSKNFDMMINYLNIQDLIKNNKNLLKIESFDNIKIKSGKKVVCGDKIYDSFFDLNDRKNLDHFYIDLQFLRVYTEVDE
tara:strand:+ start:1934 stop:3058 length:1125 start_codon:yes stop_codon:yes gene_type:complete